MRRLADVGWLGRVAIGTNSKLSPGLRLPEDMVKALAANLTLACCRLASRSDGERSPEQILTLIVFELEKKLSRILVYLFQGSTEQKTIIALITCILEVVFYRHLSINLQLKYWQKSSFSSRVSYLWKMV